MKAKAAGTIETATIAELERALARKRRGEAKAVMIERKRVLRELNRLDARLRELGQSPRPVTPTETAPRRRRGTGGKVKPSGAILSALDGGKALSAEALFGAVQKAGVATELRRVKATLTKLEKAKKVRQSGDGWTLA